MASQTLKKTRPVAQDTLDELVRRICEVVEPLQIILFGSAVRGEMGLDSDLDVLIIVPDGADRNAVWEKVYLNMFGLGIAKDIIVATLSEVERHRNNPFMIYHNAVKEGRELYRALTFQLAERKLSISRINTFN